MKHIIVIIDDVLSSMWFNQRYSISRVNYIYGYTLYIVYIDRNFFFFKDRE